VIDGDDAASGDNSGYGLLSFGASADLGMATATVSTKAVKLVLTLAQHKARQLV